MSTTFPVYEIPDIAASAVRGVVDEFLVDQVRADILTDLLLTATPHHIADTVGLAPTTFGEIRAEVQVTVTVLTLVNTNTGAGTNTATGTGATADSNVDAGGRGRGCGLGTGSVERSSADRPGNRTQARRGSVQVGPSPHPPDHRSRTHRRPIHTQHQPETVPHRPRPALPLPRLPNPTHRHQPHPTLGNWR